MSKLNLLLLDDDPLTNMSNETIAEGIKDFNSIHTATSASEATDYLKGSGRFSDRTNFPFPDLIIIDHYMPDINGLDLLDEWDDEGLIPENLMVCVLSGSPLKITQEKAEILPYVFKYLRKPLTPQQLHDVLRERVEFNRAF